MRFPFFIFGSVCFFVSFFLSGSGVSAAVSIPRNDLRLELMANGSITDTSGNNRPVSYTGSRPIFELDTLTGLPNWRFEGNGGVRVNTSWVASNVADYSFSFWVKIGPGDLLLNTADNPMIIFSAKTSSGDSNGLRFSVVSDGQCSLNMTMFPCPIKDNKWHHIAVTRKADNTSVGASEVTRVFIDGVQIFSKTSYYNQIIFGITTDETIGKVITLGSTGFTPMTSTSNFRGNIATFRQYSAPLSDVDIQNLFEEFRVQRTFSNTGSIAVTLDKYVPPALRVYIKNLPLTYAKELVTYEYALNGGTYTPVPNMSEIARTSTGIDYVAVLDLSTVGDGTVTANIRIKNGATTQNIGSVSIMKIDTPTTITINTPDTMPTPEKYITAQASLGGVLSYALTRGSVCDGTLQFDDYTDLTFTTTADNGVRVCYKAVYNNLSNKTIYKLSTSIQGILPREVTTNTPMIRIFDNYTIWPKSSYPKGNDTTSMMLDLLGVSASASQGTINGVTMTDINGDGLVDFLYSRTDPIRRAIVVNNGDFTFKTVYKCAIDPNNSNPQTYNYYGDCADFLR